MFAITGKTSGHLLKMSTSPKVSPKKSKNAAKLTVMDIFDDFASFCRTQMNSDILARSNVMNSIDFSVLIRMPKIEKLLKNRRRKTKAIEFSKSFL